MRSSIQPPVDHSATLSPGVIYERAEDMSALGKISVVLEEDGDVCLQIQGEDLAGNLQLASIQFCTVGSGGGRSPATYKALLALAAAIKTDNEIDNKFNPRPRND